jgi:hypothetical protein
LSIFYFQPAIEFFMLTPFHFLGTVILHGNSFPVWLGCSGTMATHRLSGQVIRVVPRKTPLVSRVRAVHPEETATDQGLVTGKASQAISGFFNDAGRELKEK